MKKEFTQEIAEQLFICHSAFIYRIAFFLTKSGVLADDVAQETLLQVFRKYHTYDSSKPIEPWIYKITINTTRNILRRRKWLSFTDQLPDSTDYDCIDRQVLRSEEEIELWQAINKLTQKSREVIILHYYAEMKLNDVAYTLGIPLGTCKSRLNSALTRLKKELMNNDFSVLGGLYEKY